MALFLTKPVIWNDQAYRRPSGVRVNSGWPSEHGFGHEEWNGSPALEYTSGGMTWRAFHTEGVGREPVEEEAGSIFVFMYASHDGVQELVGIAGNATCLMDNDQERQRLTEQLELDRLGDDAWAVPRVRALKKDDRRVFDEVWRRNLDWIPNWRCPADTFLWLDEPAPLDAGALRGSRKLLTMFNGHTRIGSFEALAMMDAVPATARDPRWRRIRAAIEGPPAASLGDDLVSLAKRASMSATTREQLIQARLGQGRFRRSVAQRWDYACSVSGCGLVPVLRASHIVAWSRCDDRQRLDGANGLLLTAELDALFDSGLISFDDEGSMILSPLLGQDDRKRFNLPRPLRKTPTSSQRAYLAEHRRHWVL